MITVSISINGEPLFARSAKRQDTKNENGETLYVTDSGDAIFHDYRKSAIELAKKMLDTIDEKMDNIRDREMMEMVIRLQEEDRKNG